MTRLTRAERLLKYELGVTKPSEIDLPAIAFHRGVTIKQQPLNGCEAQLIGTNKTAIAIISNRTNRQRQRFSLAHELGHWEYHKGKVLVCRTDGEFQHRGAAHPERIADDFAANLLMPRYLFEPMAKDLGRITIEAAQKLQNAFDCSLTATLIRFVELGPEPAMLVCHDQTGRKWFNRPKDIPEHWFPRDELDSYSSAFDVTFGQSEKSRRTIIGADAWFDNKYAERYEIFEQCVQIDSGRALTLIIFKDEKMLE